MLNKLIYFISPNKQVNQNPIECIATHFNYFQFKFRTRPLNSTNI